MEIKNREQAHLTEFVFGMYFFFSGFDFLLIHLPGIHDYVVIWGIWIIHLGKVGSSGPPRKRLAPKYYGVGGVLSSRCGMEINYVYVILYSLQSLCHQLSYWSLTKPSEERTNITVYVLQREGLRLRGLLKGIRSNCIQYRCFWFQVSWCSLFNISLDCYWAIFELTTNMLKGN